MGDKFLQILYPTGRRYASINVCQNKKIERVKNIIEISQEGKLPLSISFINEAEATYAFTLLGNAIDTLRPNCQSTSELPTPLYKVYTAYLYFEYNYAPVGTVFENTIGNIIWTYYNDIYGDASNIRGWKGVLTGAFPTDKLWSSVYGMDLDGNGGSGQANIKLFRNNSNEIFFIPGNSLGVYHNMEIRVYN